MEEKVCPTCSAASKKIGITVSERSHTNEDTLPLRRREEIARDIVCGIAAILYSSIGLSLLLAYWTSPERFSLSGHALSSAEPYRAPTLFALVISGHSDDVHGFLTSLASTLERASAVPQPRVFAFLTDEADNESEIQANYSYMHIIPRPKPQSAREASLFHIFSKWVELTNRTVFVEATVHDFHDYLGWANQNFIGSPGFSSGVVQTACQCKSCSSDPVWYQEADKITRSASWPIMRATDGVCVPTRDSASPSLHEFVAQIWQCTNKCKGRVGWKQWLKF